MACATRGQSEVTFWKKMNTSPNSDFSCQKQTPIRFFHALRLKRRQKKRDCIFFVIIRSYSSSHLDENGNYLFEIYPEDPDVIHVKLLSRFQSQTLHNIWVKYDLNLRLTEGQSPILNWVCTCRTGRRIFGMCAHITSVLWFFGIARNRPNCMNIRRCDLFSAICKFSNKD